MSDVTVVVPAYNEAGRVGAVVGELVEDYQVLVVDDGSTDGTGAEARNAGATVVEQPTNRGYIPALKRGFCEAETGVVVTYDADGEHWPAEVDRIVEPIHTHDLDLVLGARTRVPRPSERLLNRLTQLQIDVTDSGTGLRAMRRELAVELELDTVCTCGTLVLEAAAKGARIGEVPIETREIEKPRGIAWGHGRQLLHVIGHLWDAWTNRDGDSV